MGYHLTSSGCEAGVTAGSAYPRFAEYEAGLRFFHPGMGRWCSRDPIGEWGGINIYSFIANSPVNWIDYLGEAFSRELQVGKPFIPSYSYVKSFSAAMEVNWDCTCDPDGGYRLSLKSVDMVFHIYAGVNSMHETLHEADAKSMAYDGLTQFAKGKAGCYKSEGKAKCWKAAIEQTAVNVYFYYYAFNTVIERDIKGGQKGPDYQKQVDELFPKYKQAVATLKMKAAACDGL